MGEGMGAALHTEIALLALVFVLGLRHGLDPDHLVAIDGLTRRNRSRWTGVFFSLGHGLVVTLVGVGLALAASDWQAPVWLEISGTLVSVGTLLVLGIANLRAPLTSVRGRRMIALAGGASHPAIVAAIGAAFAVSLDTLGHALLFSAGGWVFAAGLGVLFTLGMVLTDAVNGWWVARMVRAADRRIMGIAIASLCFLTAGLGLAKFAQFSLAELAPLAGLGTLAVVAAAWLMARRSVAA